MVCPKDLVQMIQFDKVGQGVASDNLYTTWTVVTCPNCNYTALEYYSALQIDADQLQALVDKGLANFELLLPAEAPSMGGEIYERNKI